MPYYSYGYGYDSANLIYLILLVPVLLLSLYAQAAVSGNFSRYSKVTNRRGLTGAQAAAGVLRAHGITDVGIARCSQASDHYDPRNNTIFLSDSVYGAATVAAVGVAAHEAGHAVQYAVGYGPVKLAQRHCENDAVQLAGFVHHSDARPRALQSADPAAWH